MSAVGKLLLSPIAAVTGLLDKPKMPSAQPVVDQSAALAAASQQQQDNLAQRRGAAANELTGGGAEASTPGAKTLLGQ